jgi:integrase/recombinase XerD
MSQAKILTQSEFRKILLHIAKKKHHARNKAILYCSFFGCMRVGEIASLTIKDVLNDDGSIKEEVYLKPSQTKGSRGRTVYFPKKLQDEIKDYLTVRFGLKDKDLKVLHFTDTSKALFHSQKNSQRGFTPNTLCQFFTKLYSDCSINGASSHSGRRWGATQLSEKSVNPKIIQKILGHRQLQTTMLYYEVSPNSMRKAIELLS